MGRLEKKTTKQDTWTARQEKWFKSQNDDPQNEGIEEEVGGESRSNNSYSFKMFDIPSQVIFPVHACPSVLAQQSRQTSCH